MKTTFSIRHYLFGKLFLLCIVYSLINLTGAIAADLIDPDTRESANRFYNDTKHGWFWYEDPPMEPEKQEANKPPRKIPSLDAYSIEDLWTLHPDDFQELLNDLQKKAVRYPNEQNILQYLTMQDIARRKALAYTNATMYVTQKYGELFNVSQIYPTAGPGITARVKMQQSEIFQTISQAGNSHALIYFTSPNCGFCAKQTQILAYFVDKYHWPIKAIDISRHKNAATRFNINVTPTLLLIKKGQDNHMLVATGVIALSELERKLYRAIRYLQGDTKEDNFLMYNCEKNSPFDPRSILNKGRQPWVQSN